MLVVVFQRSQRLLAGNIHGEPRPVQAARQTWLGMQQRVQHGLLRQHGKPAAGGERRHQRTQHKFTAIGRVLPGEPRRFLTGREQAEELPGAVGWRWYGKFGECGHSPVSCVMNNKAMGTNHHSTQYQRPGLFTGRIGFG
ncbi:hypothetical protein BN135_3844 [Cronobacter muytjensii 530]